MYYWNKEAHDDSCIRVGENWPLPALPWIADTSITVVTHLKANILDRINLLSLSQQTTVGKIETQLYGIANKMFMHKQFSITALNYLLVILMMWLLTLTYVELASEIWAAFISISLFEAGHTTWRLAVWTTACNRYAHVAAQSQFCKKKFFLQPC